MSTHQKLIKNKLGLLKLAEELGNVSRACKVMGYSRDTFYRYKQAVDEGGVEALVEASLRKPNLHNRVAQEIEQAVLELAIEEPALGRVRVSNELRKRGLTLSPAGVRGVWIRHDLQTFRHRLVALENKIAAEGIVLTETQVAALERKREKEEASGEIETEHPGYLGSQDTFYVGTLKGVGRIYQQTFVDTYSKVAAAKLYVEDGPGSGRSAQRSRASHVRGSRRTAASDAHGSRNRVLWSPRRACIRAVPGAQ
jgi:hypothetical protein